MATVYIKQIDKRVDVKEMSNTNYDGLIKDIAALTAKTCGSVYVYTIPGSSDDIILTILRVCRSGEDSGYYQCPAIFKRKGSPAQHLCNEWRHILPEDGPKGFHRVRRKHDCEDKLWKNVKYEVYYR